MSLRLFAALDLPDDVAERLLALMKGVPGAKWRPRENLHLTLRFFGEVGEPVAQEIDAELLRVAEQTAPFELQLKAAGSFGGADPHALWVGAREPPQLKKLAAACERLKPEPRNFTPHLTLAYLSGAPLDRVQGFVTRLGLFEARPFRVEHFTLYSSWVRKSASSLYRPEAEYPLSG